MTEEEAYYRKMLIDLKILKRKILDNEYLYDTSYLSSISKNLLSNLQESIENLEEFINLRF